jgi:hypothetical protein
MAADIDAVAFVFVRARNAADIVRTFIDNRLNIGSSD